MKKQIQILLLIILTVAFSACSDKYALNNFTLPKIPSFSRLTYDPNLQPVTRLKSTTSMSHVALEWKPKTGNEIAGYRIFRTRARTSDFKLIATLSDRYRSHYTDRNIRQGASYVYRISVFTNDGRVSRTNTTQIKGSRVVLAPPVPIEITKNLPNRIKLIWRPHTDRTVKSYIIERGASRTDRMVKIANLRNRLTVEYIDKDVIPGKEYYYRIRAKSYEGVVSASSKVMSGYSKKLPLPIKVVRASNNRPKEIQITWSDQNNPKDISYYNVYSSTIKHTLFTFLGSTKKNNYVDKFSTDGVTRYYKVTAVDFDGLESPKLDTSAIGKTIAPSKAPIITVATVKENSIYIRWTDPDRNAKSYTIVKKYWYNWRHQKRKLKDHKFKYYKDSKIKPDVKYTYYIYSVDKHGIESLPSKEVVLSIRPR